MVAPGVVLYALTVTHCPELSEVMLLPAAFADPMVVPLGEAAALAAGRAALKTDATLMALFADAALIVLFAEEGVSPGLVAPLHAASTSTEAASPACQTFMSKTIPCQIFGTAGRATVRRNTLLFLLVTCVTYQLSGDRYMSAIRDC
jgi:hypothetical protein